MSFYENYKQTCQTLSAICKPPWLLPDTFWSQAFTDMLLPPSAGIWWLWMWADRSSREALGRAGIPLYERPACILTSNVQNLTIHLRKKTLSWTDPYYLFHKEIADFKKVRCIWNSGQLAQVLSQYPFFCSSTLFMSFLLIKWMTLSARWRNVAAKSLWLLCLKLASNPLQIHGQEHWLSLCR